MDFLSTIDPVYAAVLVLSALFMLGLHTVIYKFTSKTEAAGANDGPNQRNNEVQDNEEDVEYDDSGDEVEEEVQNGPNIGAAKMMGKRKRLKMERKAAMQEYRKYQLEQSKERQAAEKKRLKELRKAEKVAESSKAVEDEAWEKYIAEKRQKEQEEYEHWKVGMTVGESGSVEQERAVLENSIEQVISIINAEKVVILESLSARLNTSTNLLVELITKLVKEKQLEGIFDEAGKFIQISRDDRLKIVKIIQRRGRVDITDLTREANAVISIEPITNEPLDLGD